MRPNSQSTATLDDGRTTIWGDAFFYPWIFRRIFLLLDLPFAKGSFLAVNRVLSFFFVLKIEKSILSCYWKKVIGKGCILRIRN